MRGSTRGGTTITRGSKTSTVDAELPEWAEGARTARQRRKAVGRQLADVLCERDETGSSDVVAKRLGEAIDARRSGDLLALRAAAFELSVAAGQWTVELDLERARPGR